MSVWADGDQAAFSARGLADLILGGKLGHGRPLGVALRDLALLTGLEPARSTEHLPLLSRLGDSGLGSGEDQAALELADAAQHGQE